MVTHNLTETDKKLLKARYEADLRRLQFQISMIHQALAELNEAEEYNTLEQSIIQDPSDKQENTIKISTKKTAPVRRKQRKLSMKDKVVIDLLQSEKKPLKSKEIIDKIAPFFKKKNIDIPEENLKYTVNNLLQKLANNKGILNKIDSDGQGFSYTLSDEYQDN